MTDRSYTPLNANPVVRILKGFFERQNMISYPIGFALPIHGIQHGHLLFPSILEARVN